MKAGGTIPQAPNCLGTGRKKRLLPHSNKFELSGRNWPRLQRGHFLALGGHGTFSLCNVKEGGIALCNEKASRPPRTQMLVPPFFWRGFFFGPFSTTRAAQSCQSRRCGCSRSHGIELLVGDDEVVTPDLVAAASVLRSDRRAGLFIDQLMVRKIREV
jgi:hypothetical protein